MAVKKERIARWLATEAPGRLRGIQSIAHQVVSETLMFYSLTKYRYRSAPREFPVCD
jgi:hypothetical protein